MNPERVPAVLVVDDDPSHCLAVARIFERAGYRVRTAPEGREALAIMNQGLFDLVVTDLRMPGMGGLELLRNIRAMNAQVAVMLITAFGEWTTYLNAMDAGAVDYLNKPVRREDLLVAARKALARHGMRAPDASATSAADAGTSVP